MDRQAALDAIAADAARGDLIFPTHAQTALQVRRLLDDPDCAVDALIKLIAAEPVLSAKIVGLANSVAYNPFGRATQDLRGAISRLGFRTLRSLATAVIVRQMREAPLAPAHRTLADQLWQHTAEVAALARVIASKLTHHDPEAAFFAGIVHEVGAFYLLGQAQKYPGLLEGDLEIWHDEGEARIGQAVLSAFQVPDEIMAAMHTLWDSYLSFPPESLGDTLLLANELAETESPFDRLSGQSRLGSPADIDALIGEGMLKETLATARAEIDSLRAALDQ